MEYIGNTLGIHYLFYRAMQQSIKMWNKIFVCRILLTSLSCLTFFTYMPTADVKFRETKPKRTNRKIQYLSGQMSESNKNFNRKKKQKQKHVTETTHSQTINVSFYSDMTYFDRHGHAVMHRRTVPNNTLVHLSPVFCNLCVSDMYRHVSHPTDPSDHFRKGRFGTVNRLPSIVNVLCALPDTRIHTQIHSTSRRRINLRMI